MDEEYKLKGIVVHWGSLEHGHYIAVVGRGDDKWYYCNDSKVSECEEKVGLKQEAYLLFYEKRTQ